MYVADTLTRAQLSDSSTDKSEKHKLPVHTMINNLPVSDVKKIQLQGDEQMRQLSQMIKTGRPANIINVS